jgi:hypothetical protein
LPDITDDSNNSIDRKEYFVIVNQWGEYYCKPGRIPWLAIPVPNHMEAHLFITKEEAEQFIEEHGFNATVRRKIEIITSC